MVRKAYRFGGRIIAIESPAPFVESGMCRPFEAAGRPNHTIAVRFSDTLPHAPADALRQGPVHRWYDAGGCHTLHCYSLLSAAPQFICAVTLGGRTELTFSHFYREHLSSRAILESAGLFELLAMHRQLVLHASYVLTAQSGAILFSGPSGVGKSTQAALWERFAGARVINGDRALVRLDNLTANGIFYSGTSGICENVSAPIRAVVLLAQRPENTLTVARPAAAFAALLSQCAYYPWDERSAARMTDLAAQLVSSLPVYQLGCRPDASAVSLLQAELRRT